MAQTETYANLLSLIESYHGANLIDIEKTRVRHLVNARARSAYRESDLWDQFLVTGEERVVNDADPSRVFVPFKGATSAAPNVTSIQAGDIDTVLRAHDQNPFATSSAREFEVFMGKDGVELPGYKVAYGSETGVTGFSGGSPNYQFITAKKVDAVIGGTFQVSGFVTVDGTATDAALNATHKATNFNFLTDSQTLLDFSLATTITAGNVSAVKIKLPVVFLTYKRQLSEIYGDQLGDKTTIPLEWKDYIALGVFADMLASDGFVEKSLAIEARAANALQGELERIDRNRAHQFVNHRVRTHGSDQARQTTHM